MIETYNPATGKLLAKYKDHSPEEISGLISKAHKAYMEWQIVPMKKRSELMRNAAGILINKKSGFAELMALEMGKPIKQGIAEAEKCAWVCNYYADNAESQLSDDIIETEFSKSYACFRPLGLVLAIMPWNFPFWQVFRFAAPALMAGNGGLLKHSRNTMGCAIEIDNIFRGAGFPEGLFTTLVIGSSPVQSVIEHELVSAVTLTGSTPVGSKVASQAGKMIKKAVMELGGSDPYIILKDADIEKAAEACAVGRLINSGQSCIAAKRFIVEKDILSEFESQLKNKMEKYQMGDPLDESNNIGPQARKDLQLDLDRQTKSSVNKGAKLLLGGVIPDSPGYYYPPTILTNVTPGMAAFDEETFGPIAAIIPAENEADAVNLANMTEFGLGAAIFTNDLEKGEYLAKYEIHAGSCFVNDFVRSDPRLPFGGIKGSGYGRELASYGIKEFVNIKTVCVR